MKYSLPCNPNSPEIQNDPEQKEKHNQILSNREGENCNLKIKQHNQKCFWRSVNNK